VCAFSVSDSKKKKQHPKNSVPRRFPHNPVVVRKVQVADFLSQLNRVGINFHVGLLDNPLSLPVSATVPMLWKVSDRPTERRKIIFVRKIKKNSPKKVDGFTR